MASTTSNSEQQLDPLTRIVQKRRQDCETLGKDVVAALVEAPWKEYTSKPSEYATMNFIDPLDRLQRLLTVYLDQAGKDNESTFNRRKAWNAAQGLLRKIDELLKAKRQTVEAQPSLQTAPMPNAAGTSKPAETAITLPTTSHVGVVQTRWGPRATTTATSKVINAPTAPVTGNEKIGGTGNENTRKTAPSGSGATNGTDRGTVTTSEGISQQTTRKAAPTQATASNGKRNGVSNGASTHALGQPETQAAASSVPARTNSVDSSQVSRAAARSDFNPPSTQEQSRGSNHTGLQQPARKVAPAQAAVQNGVGNRSLTNGSSHDGLGHHALSNPAGRAARRNVAASEQPHESNHLEHSSLPASPNPADPSDPSSQALTAKRSSPVARRNSSTSEQSRDFNHSERSNSSRIQNDAASSRPRSSSPHSRSQSDAATPIWDPRIQFSPAPNGGNDSTGSTGRPAGVAQRNQQGREISSSGDVSHTRSAQAQRLEYRGNPDESNGPSHAQANRPPTELQTSQRPEQNTAAKSVVLMLLADNAPTLSGSIKERANIRITVEPRALVSQAFTELTTRLNEGDPFWCITSVINAGVTSPVSKPNVEAARTAARIDINLSKPRVRSLIPSMTWGKIPSDSPKDGDVALILRMLPIGSNGSKKRADCHLWPQGTFLQVDGNAIRLQQRKQQGHDLKQWKGMCKHLDVTEHISNPKKVTRIQLCCYDDQPYLYCLAFCKFRSVNSVYSMLMNPKLNFVERLSREEGFRKAIEYVNANGQMVVLDSDNDESEPEAAKLIFSLICPISKTLMQAPVRGKNCKHWQVRIITGCE
jgi:hypothetical protein